MAIDPVCGTEAEPGETTFTVRYMDPDCILRGRGCSEEFRGQPERHAGGIAGRARRAGPDAAGARR